MDSKELVERLLDSLQMMASHCSVSFQEWNEHVWSVQNAAVHIAAQDARIEADARTIATLRADLAKAVEGLEAIACQKWECALGVQAATKLQERCAHCTCETMPCFKIGRAQSLIKELRP